MSDIIQVADLEKTKLHNTFHVEAVTGKEGGLAGGADIDFTTNAVTGQVQKTLPKILADIDWSYVGLFTDGVTFTKRTDFALDAVGIQWVYVGAYPFTATAGTVPTEPTYQVVHVSGHPFLSGLNPADGSAHNANDIGRGASTVDADLTLVESNVSSLESIKYKEYGSYRSLLDGLNNQAGASPFFRKVNADRLEMFTPFMQSGRYLRWRFDKDESQFHGSPSDTAQGYSRPFLQTTVIDVFLENSGEVVTSAATASIAPVVSGAYSYISGIGEYFEFTGILASRLRCTYNATTNAGIVKVEINGGSSLVNLLPKDGAGDALLDTYGLGGGVSTLLAENLPDEPLTIRFTIVGQNPSSTGNRLYLSDSVVTGALRAYTPYAGTGTPRESVGETLKLGGSAVEYAISFRPDSIPAANTPFIGSVHGYENATLKEVYIDNKLLSYELLADGEIVSARSSITLYQETEIFHPDSLVTKAATVSITSALTSAGLTQGYKWTWDYSPFITNGYTQMWTVYGANSGGAGGAQLGWSDRVTFRGCDTYDLINGDSAELGHHITDEVLFYGTPQSESRNADSGLTACLVSIADPLKSFSKFEYSEVAESDAIWVQDRATFRKMYLQSLRAAGTVASGTSVQGSMKVLFYKSPKMYNLINGF